MSPTNSNNHRRRCSRKRRNSQKHQPASACGAGGAFGAPSDSSKKRKSAPTTPSKADLKKQKKVGLTGKEIAESWEGGCLEPLTDIVVSLSRQIVLVIEETATSMLDLSLEIADRKTSLARFNLKIKDKETGTEDLFAPSCCRLKNPVTGSQLVKDSEEFKTVVSKYQTLVNEHKTQARTILLNAAKLEVSSRETKLRELMTDTLLRLSRNLVIKGMVRGLKEGKTFNLSQNELAIKAARHWLVRDQMPDAEIIKYLYATKAEVTLAFDKIITSGKSLPPWIACSTQGMMMIKLYPSKQSKSYQPSSHT